MYKAYVDKSKDRNSQHSDNSREPQYPTYNNG